jgi:metacaspase-1
MTSVKRALCIGINYSSDASASLRGCINDTLNVRDILIKNFNYKAENIVMMNDESADELKPTRANILRQIFNLVQGSTDNNTDTLFFQYSGHGSNVRDGSGDEKDGRDEVIIPLDYKTQGVITDDDLYKLLVAPLKKNQKLTCLIDSCHSGTVLDLQYNVNAKTEPIQPIRIPKYNYKEWRATMSISLNNKMKSNGQVVMLSGCEDHELSNDAKVGPTFQGIMTYCFISVLKDAEFKVKYKHLLKDINCMLDLYGFKVQNSQLSFNTFPNLELQIEL